MKRREEVAHLVRQGLTVREIAAYLRVHPGTVHHHIWRARMAGMHVPTPPRRSTAGLPIKVYLPAEVARVLHELAADRRVPVPELIEKLITTIVEDKLISAVLDDTPPKEGGLA